MLRVAHVIESVQAAGGGTSTAFLTTVNALATHKSVAVTAFTSPPPPDDSSSQAIRATTRVTWHLSQAAGKLRAVRAGPLGQSAAQHIRAGHADLCHLHGLWSLDLVAAAGACRERGIPFVWQPHGMLVTRALKIKRLKKQLFMRLFAERELKGAGAFVFASRGELESSELPGGYPRSRCYVVPLPVEPPGAQISAADALQGRQRFGLPKTAPVVLFLGRLHPVKRIELTLKAFALAHADVLPASLLLVGAGEEEYTESLKTLAAQLGIGERVVFAGWAGGRDKWLALAAADVLILNSEFENFGYVIAEALSAAIPVVVTDNLALSAEVAAAGAGIAAQGEPDTLGLALTSMLTRPDRAEAGRLGRAWVESTMSPEAVAARMLAVYEAVARPAQPVPAPAVQTPPGVAG